MVYSVDAAGDQLLAVLHWQY